MGSRRKTLDRDTKGRFLAFGSRRKNKRRKRRRSKKAKKRRKSRRSRKSGILQFLKCKHRKK